MSHLEKCVTLGKMCHTWKNGSHFQPRSHPAPKPRQRSWERGCHTSKNVSLLIEWVTSVETSYALLDGLHSKNWVAFRKMGHIWKNGSHMQKWFKLGEIGHTWKNGSHLGKRVTLKKRWVTLGKMGHSYKNGPHLKILVKRKKNGSKISGALENGPHLEKWVTLGQMGRT